MKKGKYALVTGATKGIGKAVSLRLAAEGYHLFLTSRSKEDLKQLHGAIVSSHTHLEVHSFACDFAQMKEVVQLTEFVDANCAQLDLLVNNVGTFSTLSIMDTGMEDVIRLFHVNYFAAHYLSSHFGKQMAKSGEGHIVNVSSVAALEPASHASVYGVTKIALHGLTVNLREELLPHGVRVSEIFPGATLTASWQGTPVPKDRFVAPDDIANALIACLSVGNTASVDEIIVRPLKGRF